MPFKNPSLRNHLVCAKFAHTTTVIKESLIPYEKTMIKTISKMKVFAMRAPDSEIGKHENRA